VARTPEDRLATDGPGRGLPRGQAVRYRPRAAQHSIEPADVEGTRLISEPKSSWTEVADRLLTWGMVITIPLIGIFGFGLLTTVKHSPPGPTAGVSGSVLAAPEVTDTHPSVELKHALAPCPAAAAPTAAAPCARPVPIDGATFH